MGRAKADGSGGPTKAEMVRSALSELGADAKPQALQDYIKAKYNRELPKPLISNYKSTLMKRGGGPAAAGNGPGRPRKAAGGGAVDLNDLEAVRGLIDRHGADGVRRLVAVLS